MQRHSASESYLKLNHSSNENSPFSEWSVNGRHASRSIVHPSTTALSRPNLQPTLFHDRFHNILTFWQIFQPRFSVSKLVSFASTSIEPPISRSAPRHNPRFTTKFEVTLKAFRSWHLEAVRLKFDVMIRGLFLPVAVAAAEVASSPFVFRPSDKRVGSRRCKSC